MGAAAAFFFVVFFCFCRAAVYPNPAKCTTIGRRQSAPNQVHRNPSPFTELDRSPPTLTEVRRRPPKSTEARRRVLKLANGTRRPTFMYTTSGWPAMLRVVLRCLTVVRDISDRPPPLPNASRSSPPCAARRWARARASASLCVRVICACMHMYAYGLR